jgi:hypothetical protein
MQAEACPMCGNAKGWRHEGRGYNKRGLCRCSGVGMLRGVEFPHRTTHPLCDHNPNGPRNQELRRGTKPEELPIELMGVAMRDTDDCPF